MVKLNIFFYRELSYYVPFKKESIPTIIKNYYRHIALPRIDYEYYLNQILTNFNWENHDEISCKILYLLNYVSNKMSFMKKNYLVMHFILKIISDVAKCPNHDKIYYNDEPLDLLKIALKKKYK